MLFRSLHDFEEIYRPIFEQYNLSIIFLVTPQTSEERIRRIDNLTNSFIYLVSSASTTGNKVGGDEKQIKYFERIKNMQLRNPKLIGFGISDHDSFALACRYAEGAIIGSAFIKKIQETNNLENNIQQFIQEIKATEAITG